MPVSFEIAHVDRFPLEIARAPKKVRSAIGRVTAELRNHPQQPRPPKIKRLKGYKDLWRYRIGDSHRLVYRLDRNSNPQMITMLMLDDRKEVYNRLGASAEGEPGPRIIAAEAKDLIEFEPTERQIGEAILATAIERADTPSPGPDAQLPVALTPAILGEWGVPARYHASLVGVDSDSALLGLIDDIPSATLERVMNGMWPPEIEHIVEQPIRLSGDNDGLLAAAEGQRSLESFLLKLDPDQEAFVGRFRRDQPQGPWLLKGAPGSGKSVVALYCIKELIQAEDAKLPGQGRRLRVLLTTYTNSLINASKHLLATLGVAPRGHEIRVATVDQEAARLIPAESRGRRVASDDDLRSLASNALNQCSSQTPAFSFRDTDIIYLLDEIDWVILGQGIDTVDDYLNNADRSGRGRPLGKRQRQHVWILHEALQALLDARRLTRFSQRQRAALDNAVPNYDYVFIDEAQDLKPIAIRLCVSLCKERRNTFVTADSNQSIYGSGISWASVADELRFQGRAQILRKNYRTTSEIWGGISQLAPAEQALDLETLDTETAYSGPWPRLGRYRDDDELAGLLNGYLYEALREERLGPDSAAVLCPTGIEMRQTLSLLRPEFNAKMMRSKNLDLRHRGLKVLTMHAAKGLEFPVVAVVGVNQGRLPRSEDADDPDLVARQQRLLFVAASRAMRHLLILTDAAKPSVFLGGITDDKWTIDHL